MENKGIYLFLSKEWERFSSDCVRYAGTLLARIRDVVVEGSPKYRGVEAQAERQLRQWKDTESRLANEEQKTRRISGYERAIELQEGNIARLQQTTSKLEQELQESTEARAELALELIGINREYKKQEPEIARLIRENNQLRRSERMKSRRLYDRGSYKRKAILVTDEDSRIITQNITARNLLGHLKRIKLTEIPNMSINEDRPSIVKLGGELYSFEFNLIHGGYEVEVKKATEFYRRSKAPQALCISVIPDSAIIHPA